MTVTASITLVRPRRGGVSTTLLALLVVGLAAALVTAIGAVAPRLTAAPAESFAPVSAAGPPGVTFTSAASALTAEDATVTVGEVSWDQTAAVYAAHPMNPLAAAGFEWVTAPVTVTAIGPETVGLVDLEVTLVAGEMAMSHRFKNTSLYPVSTLPGELDIAPLPAGQTREGTVGWMVPSHVQSAGTCLIRVSYGDAVLVQACSLAQ